MSKFNEEIEDTVVFEYLASDGIEFIFAIKQFNTVKKRGKNVKNKEVKTKKRNILTVLKERNLLTENQAVDF